MRIARPHSVIFFEVGIGALQPGCVGMSILLGSTVDIDEHGTEEGRLGTREIVRAIGIEHGAVMLDLKKEIVDHPTRQLQATRAQQAANNEVTVPTIHFVETSAGDDIFVRQVQQPVRLNLAGIDLAQAMDLKRQMFHANVAGRR